MGKIENESKVYHMITHGNEKVEEQGATLLHLDLHRAALLEVVAATDDEGEILGSKLRVRVRCVIVGVAC